MTYEQIYRVATLVYITNNKDNKIISGTATNQNIFFASLCIQATFWNAAMNPECTLQQKKISIEIMDLKYLDIVTWYFVVVANIVLRA